jgi:polyhydroxyalkanoate synthesis repressor PhaR
MASGRVVIKKYGNRRLYDTSASRYVNLDEIAGMVRNGTDVQVLDAKTGEDLTRATLMQVIAEDTKGQHEGLPLELIRQLIMASDHVGREFIMWYLKSAFDTYHRVQNALQSGLSEVQSAAMSPLSMVERFMQRKPAAAPVSGPDNSAKDDELRELRERLADLEARQARGKKPRRTVTARNAVTARKKKGAPKRRA